MAADPRAVLGHLADETRLRTFAAVVLGARDTGEIAARAELSERDVLKALTRLSSAGLVERNLGGWVARPHVMAESVAAASERVEPMDHGVDDPAEAAVLRTFMPEGRLTQIPTTRSKRLVILDHVCRVFEPGERYSEREVVALLRVFHDDHAALRRYLVDEGFLSRGGGVYWRSGETVVL